MKTWALVANGGVLYARESEDSPGADWREVLADEKPTPSESEDVVETGWEITSTTAKRTWALVAKPLGPVVRAEPTVTEIARWQLKEELDDRSLLDAVSTWLQSLTAAQRRRAQISWQDKPFIRRADPFTEALRVGLSLTATQMDDVFLKASRRK
jgi:hypothetical protein